MSDRYALRKEYKEFLARSLSPEGARRRRRIQVGGLVAVALVYALLFFDLYPLLYGVMPDSLRQFTFDFYPALERIEAQMVSRGETLLFSKYLVFSQMNFLVLVLTFVAAIFFFEGRRDSQSEFSLGATSCLCWCSFRWFSS